ncbi:MAG: nucleotide exchange factor GrpE [Wenzhouxiangellaceae bacterium]
MNQDDSRDNHPEDCQDDHQDNRQDNRQDNCNEFDDAGEHAEADLNGQSDELPRDGEASADAKGPSTRDHNDSDELVRMKETVLRLQAEMDNREKRLEREMVKARKFALESLMRDLVPVLDSMDQALSSADADDAKAAYDGLELTRKQALQVLTSHGLEVLDPAGEKFDPSWHEAMATQPGDEYDPDTIVQVLQKGYRLNERLIRPARVIVAKGD